MFTMDEEILEAMAHYDQTYDGEEEDEDELLRSCYFERPSTADEFLAPPLSQVFIWGFGPQRPQAVRPRISAVFEKRESLKIVITNAKYACF